MNLNEHKKAPLCKGSSHSKAVTEGLSQKILSICKLSKIKAKNNPTDTAYAAPPPFAQGRLRLVQTIPLPGSLFRFAYSVPPPFAGRSRKSVLLLLLVALTI